jgi:hypothetical protein
MKELREDRRPAAGIWYRIIFDNGCHSFYRDYFNGFGAGNYAFFLDGQCVYVGQTADIKARMRSHIKMMRYQHSWQTTWGQFHVFTVAARKEKYRFERLMLEARLIHRIRPVFNKYLKGDYAA